MKNLYESILDDEDVDGIVKEQELKTDNLIEDIKVMDKTAWINNL